MPERGLSQRFFSDGLTDEVILIHHIKNGMSLNAVYIQQNNIAQMIAGWQIVGLEVRV